MRRLAAWLAILALIFPVAGCRTSPAKSGGVPQVLIAQATEGKVGQVDELLGKVKAVQEVNLLPKISGRIKEINFNLGDRVKAGQVVFTLSVPEIEAEVARAQAGVKQAQAAKAAAETSLAQANFQVEQARAALEQARTALEQAKENFRLAEENYKRGKFLLDQGAIAKATFEQQFETPYINAKANMEQAQSALTRAEAAYQQAVNYRDKVVPAQIRQAQAAEEAAQAALAAAETTLAQAVVVSPIDGYVVARNAEVGELVGPQMPMPVLTIAQLDPILVEIMVPEDKINLVKVGEKLAVRFPALEERVLEGKVKYISPASNPQTKGYTVQIELSNPDLKLKPGMAAVVLLGGEKGLLVPREAVTWRQGEPVVFVLKDKKASPQRVLLGPSDGQWVVVREGIKPGDWVVVTGQDRLGDKGGKVEIAGKWQVSR
ncbi:efflux transporter, RND family, MFP subunit [Ammonifex degensii KC4]|uniref:Efflux transporter, RND family, MFP subunit n=1 Tax=Ammonifex degensii (strain DSM 10501 / KC4) TaxID=429009 RepID=C9RAJ7_AMMDK|nr:efflux RND transporter periplasmic adaptor subunit [Ammonifex degensii]ACX51274.1 efflux transporter, RND family, MFP subunit [Ammonifex degensii KC4]